MSLSLSLSLFHVQILNLGNNNLDTIETGAFNGLDNLQYIVLNGNALTRLDADMLTGLGKIRYLVLDNNNVRYSTMVWGYDGMRV